MNPGIIYTYYTGAYYIYLDKEINVYTVNVFRKPLDEGGTRRVVIYLEVIKSFECCDDGDGDKEK